MPGTTLDLMYDLLPSLRHLDDTQKERVVIEGRYKPFLKRQAAEVAALKRDEDLKLDINLDYNMYVVIKKAIASVVVVSKHAMFL